MAKSLARLEKRLAGYAAAAGLALAMPASADAQIVYVDINPDIVLTPGNGFNLDLDSDAGVDFAFVDYSFLAYILQASSNLISAYSGAYPRMVLGLITGSPISGAFGTGSYGILGVSSQGQFPGAGDKYVGVRFVADRGGASSNHFAWIRVNLAADNSTLTIKDYAFEATPDTPINGGTIPVELVFFEARVNGGIVTLNWETGSESNNAGFEMQMKQGENWNVLGFVEGNGTTTEAQTYSYRADGMDVGRHTFRLKQIDFDGAFKYSAEVEAIVEVVGTHQLSNAYPNPFNRTSQFTLAVARDQRVTAELYNVLGQRVATLFEGSVEENASEVVRIDGATLGSGAYIVRVNGETFSDAVLVTLSK